MDRIIPYPGQIPTDAMFLNTNQNAMVALGILAQAVLGTGTVADGLACTQTTIASLGVLVGPGSIYSVENLESTSYGSLPADTADQIVKQGIILGNTTFSCPAPTTSGQSIVYLVQAQYEDVDGGSTVLPYYNAANPAVPYSGPANSGAAQNTIRKGVCVLSLKAGIAATTGSQATPSPDAGYVGLYAITVANGQTTVTSTNIKQLASAPFIGTKLPAVLSAIQSGAANFAQDTSGAANTITITLNPAVTSLTAGIRANVKVANSVTGATVMNTNGLGNVSVVTTSGAALSANAMQANGVYSLIYDGTHWQLQGSTAVSTTNGYFYGATSGGSANAQTLASVFPTGYALSQGNAVAFTAGFTNTGATTLSVNSTTVTSVKKDTGSGIVALTGGEIVAGNDYLCYYDGTQYVLIDPSTLAFLNSPALTGVPTAPTAALGTNTNQLATMAAIFNAVAAISKSVVANIQFTGTTTGAGGVTFSNNLAKNRSATGIFDFTGTLPAQYTVSVIGQRSGVQPISYERLNPTTSGFTIQVWDTFNNVLVDPTSLDVTVNQY